MKLTYVQTRKLREAAHPDGWKTGNTNRTAEAMLRLGAIEAVEFDGCRVVYRPTAAGYEAMNAPHGTKTVALADVPVS